MTKEQIIQCWWPFPAGCLLMFLNSFDSSLCNLLIHNSIHQVMKPHTIVSSRPTCSSHPLLEVDSLCNHIHDALISHHIQTKPWFPSGVNRGRVADGRVLLSAAKYVFPFSVVIRDWSDSSSWERIGGNESLCILERGSGSGSDEKKRW